MSLSLWLLRTPLLGGERMRNFSFLKTLRILHPRTDDLLTFFAAQAGLVLRVVLVKKHWSARASKAGAGAVFLVALAKNAGRSGGPLLVKLVRRSCLRGRNTLVGWWLRCWQKSGSELHGLAVRAWPRLGGHQLTVIIKNDRSYFWAGKAKGAADCAWMTALRAESAYKGNGFLAQPGASKIYKKRTIALISSSYGT